MRTKIILILCLTLLVAFLAYGAGSVTPTGTPRPRNGLNRVELDWTSDASGDVSGTNQNIYGYLLRVTFVPDSGSTRPSNLYDVQVQDADDIDLLNGSGSDLPSDTNTSISPTISDSVPVVAGNIELVVSNAGNAKGGKVVIYYQEP